MNKKQAFIIATLLVLIVCAGILATKVNNPLYVDGDSSALTLNDQAKDPKATDFFAESRINREQQNAKTLETLKTIMDEQNASKEAKDQASAKYKDLALAGQYEAKIETQLKAKGFDSYCSIDDGKVNIMVKSKDQLTAQQNKSIKDIVLTITKIRDIAIERKE